jgi:hypothetical protein
MPWMQGRRLCVVRYLQNRKDKSNEGFLCKHVSSFLAPFYKIKKKNKNKKINK